MSLSSQFKAASVISFDVFDTLLLRNTKPEPLRFKEISTDWAKAIGNPELGKDLFYSRLLAARISYRTIAKNLGCREAKYSHILKTVCQLNNIGVELVSDLTDAELRYETNNLKLNRALSKDLQRAVEDGKPIIAISDMYFSAEEIRRLIEHLAPELAGYKIYSSSDSGLNKASGALYEFVANKEGLALDSTWLHIGDNYHSDVVRAREVGLSATYTPRGRAWRFVSKFRRIATSLMYKLGSH